MEEKELQECIQDIGATLNNLDHYDRCLVLAGALAMQIYLMGETSMIFSWPPGKLDALREGIGEISESLKNHSSEE